MPNGSFYYTGNLPKPPQAPKMVFHEGQNYMSKRFGPKTWYKLTEWQAKYHIWSWMKRAEATGKLEGF